MCSAGKWDGKCAGEVKPATETCSGKDDDCDGKVDEEYAEQGKACTVPGKQGERAKGTRGCTSGKLVCSGPRSVAKTCNGKDDDCDGMGRWTKMPSRPLS